MQVACWSSNNEQEIAKNILIVLASLVGGTDFFSLSHISFFVGVHAFF